MFSNNTHNSDVISDLYSFLDHMIEDDRTLLLSMSPVQKVTTVVILTLSLIWGTLMKVFVYYSISGQKVSERPVNVLIIVEQILHHIFNYVIIAGSLVKVSIVGLIDI
jgi:hypothetical protein